MKASRFVLSYDQANLPVAEGAFEAFVKNNRFVIQWAKVYPGLYLLKSTSDAKELAHSFNDIIEPASFVIAKLSSTYSRDWNGVLQRAVWDWFDNDNADEEAPPALKD